MRVDTKDIVCKVAYLIGVRKELMHNNFDDSCPEVIEQLENDQNATVIHYLCKLRTSLMMTFRKTDDEIWALVFSLPEADFLVMVEWNKCGQAIKDALEHEGIFWCSLDDFSTGKIEDLKRAVLIAELKKYLPDLWSYNGKELVRKLYADTRIEADETEMMNFYNKYIRTISLQADVDGNFKLLLKALSVSKQFVTFVMYNITELPKRHCFGSFE